MEQSTNSGQVQIYPLTQDAQEVKIVHSITHISEQIPRTPEIIDLVSLWDPSSLRQWLQNEFQTVASIIIIEFPTRILFRCILSGLQGGPTPAF